MKTFFGVIDAGDMESKTLTILCKSVVGAEMGQLVIVIPFFPSEHLSNNECLTEYVLLKRRLSELEKLL